jgi:enoyl-CoA hydratase/carnithine racemase
MPRLSRSPAERDMAESGMTDLKMADLEMARQDGVLRLAFNRPAKKNALTGAMYDGASEALEAADRDAGIGAIVLHGTGGTFTAGNDIADFLAAGETDGASRAHRFVRAIAACETPIVAAVEGVAVGVGMTMLFHCDLVYLAPNATLRMPFVDLGLVPEAASSLLVPRRVGLVKASELLLLGEPIGAAEAVRVGIANAVVEPGQLLDHAMRQAGRLAAKPRSAIAATRRLIRGDREEVLARLEAESVAFATALRSPEARAAFASFLQKKAG